MPDYSLYAIDKHIYKHRTYESNPDSWQVFTSALNTAILFHIATPIYVKDVVSEIECEKTDYQRNHPCVVFWSLGNELQTYANLPFGDWGVTPYRMMKPVLQRYDPTRKITVAMHPRGRSLTTDSIPAPLVFETDIAAYNYRYMYFPGDRRNNPWMVFYQSEANTSNMGPNFFEMDLDKVIGLAYWGQIDYLGESQGWPAKGWAQGSFDMSLQPKPIAYLLKSMFSDEPTIHIGVIDDGNSNIIWNDVQVGTAHMSENWNRKPGSKASINVYTNCDRVEILSNGKKVAEKENTLNPKNRNKIRIDNIDYDHRHLPSRQLWC